MAFLVDRKLHISDYDDDADSDIEGDEDCDFSDDEGTQPLPMGKAMGPTQDSVGTALPKRIPNFP